MRTSKNMKPATPAQAPLERLIDINLHLQRQTTEAGLNQAVVAEAAALLDAQRVLLVLQPDAGQHQVVGTLLPNKESADALLRAITPWLDEALSTGSSRLRHGPEGAEPIDQRSCLVAPLLSPQGLLGCLYADIEGSRGRFEEIERLLLTMLAAQAAVALANLRAAALLKAEALRRAAGEHAALTAQQASAGFDQERAPRHYRRHYAPEKQARPGLGLCEADPPVNGADKRSNDRRIGHKDPQRQRVRVAID